MLWWIIHTFLSGLVQEASSAGNLESAIVVESKDALLATQELDVEVASEVQGVQLILTKAGQLWLVSDRDQIIPKHTQLGGYGTGQYAKVEDPVQGPELEFPNNDKTVVQVDETTLVENAASNTVSTMTMYKLLVRLEREKQVTQHKVSYMDISRDTSVEAGLDSFVIKPNQRMKFKVAASERMSCKNLFSKCISVVETSTALSKTFRFRFEKVGKSLKVQKPYVICTVGLSLTKGKPLKVA